MLTRYRTRKSSRGFIWLLMVAALAFAVGVVWVRYFSGRGAPDVVDTSTVTPPEPDWSGFTRVQVPGADGNMQEAYFLAAPGPAPLVVSLHTWGGDFAEPDPLAPLARAAGWAYIHPDVRGPNWTADACLSDKVVADLDDAIRYAMANGNVDPANIVINGFSGGGYTALGYYLRGGVPLNAVLAWAPISDLEAWYQQSRHAGRDYAGHILRCTESGDTLDVAAARRRSPLHMAMPPLANGRLELFAGIDDGYDGSVPTLHSVRFYNRAVRQYGMPENAVDSETALALLSRTVMPNAGHPPIGGRTVIYRREDPAATLTIFAGGHEMLPAYAAARIGQIVAP